MNNCLDCKHCYTEGIYEEPACELPKHHCEFDYAMMEYYGIMVMPDGKKINCKNFERFEEE